MESRSQQIKCGRSYFCGSPRLLAFLLIILWANLKRNRWYLIVSSIMRQIVCCARRRLTIFFFHQRNTITLYCAHANHTPYSIFYFYMHNEAIVRKSFLANSFACVSSVNQHFHEFLAAMRLFTLDACEAGRYSLKGPIWVTRSPAPPFRKYS